MSESKVKSFYRLQKNKGMSPSENVISKLESSMEHISIDANKDILAWTLHWLNEDHELEEFVAGIPGLYESVAFTHNDGDDIRPVLAALPGPTSFHAPLPWSIIWLAQRTSTIQQKRSCLKALYYIPGAIRDLLASYAAGKHYCLEILPLLNSPESLEIIDELWDTPNDDVALSARCVAAAVAAFVITPPRRVLDHFLTPDVRLIVDDDTGRQFLDNRLHVGADTHGGGGRQYQPHSDSARLQNIACFLGDIKNALLHINFQVWRSDNPHSIRREIRALYDVRHTEEYRTGCGTFDQHGDRTSITFIPAVQQDLIALTLEILARDPVAAAATAQREAFRGVCHQLVQQATAQARTQAQSQTYEILELDALAMRSGQTVNSIEMVKRSLEPVLVCLSQTQSAEIPTWQSDDTSSLQIGLTHVGTSHRRRPPPTPPHILISQYSVSSAAGLATTVGDLGNSPLWGTQAPVAV